MKRLAAAIVFLGLGCDTPVRVPPPDPAKVPRIFPSHREPTGPIKQVIVVSIDGLLPEAYVHPDAHGLKVPTLRKLVAEGAAALGGVEPVFPTVTYPAHTSMVTGVAPGKHGIVGNRTFDPLREDQDGWRWYAEDVGRDPIWRLVEREGFTAATVWWPVTTGAAVTWRVPEYWRARDDNDRKLLRALSTPGLLEEVAAKHTDFWPRFAPPAVRDDALTDVALHIYETGKPTLLLLHLVEVDGEQHSHGLWSEGARAAMERDDAQVGRLVAAASPDTRILVVSDHGFLDAPKMVHPCVPLHEAGIRTAGPDWQASLLNNSGQVYIYLKDPKDAPLRARVLSALSAKSKDPSNGISRAYSEEEIVAIGGDPKATFALEAAPGFQFGSACEGAYIAEKPTYVGTHGYDPRRPELRASMLMYGANTPKGILEQPRLIDVGPTVASWLGIPMPNVDGVPLRVSPR